jgi:hypothetical protein
MSKFKAGVLGAVLLVLITYGGFTKFANRAPVRRT